jgi:hypothetical protein
MTKETRKIRKTKMYVVTNQLKMSPKSLYYFFFTRGFWIDSVVKVGAYNYIVMIDYQDIDEAKVNALIGNHKSRGVNLLVRRIFKSMSKIGAHGDEPTMAFLNEIMLLASARIRGEDIKVVSSSKEADKWQKALLKMWQAELDSPFKFKKLGIVPQTDISPTGKLRLHMNAVGKHLIVYFDEDISKYYIRPEEDKEQERVITK